MKKFSKITGFNIPQEKEVQSSSHKMNEEELFRTKVQNLLEDLLTIRTYGPIHRYLIAGSIKIAGKELFVEALMDLLKEKSLTQETKILESLKSSIQDWQVLDSKIEEVEKNVSKIKLKRKVSSYITKIESIYNSYSQDEELLLTMIEESSKKITNSETAYLNSVAAEILGEEKYSKDLFSKISEKYKLRSKHLLDSGK